VRDVEYLRFDNGTYNVATHVFTPNTPPPLPLVSVIATDGVGTEAVDGTDFTFTFSRTGDLSQALTVKSSRRRSTAQHPAWTSRHRPGRSPS